MASQRTPGFGAPQRPDGPPAGGLGFSAPPQGYGPVNQGISQGAPRPAQGFAPQGSYSGGHLPGGASAPPLPAGPSSAFAQYPPPGGTSFPRLPYGAQNDITTPHGTPFGLTMPGAGAGFQPQSFPPLQGGYEPQPPALGLGSRQTQRAAYEQGRRSPQGGGRPQPSLSENSSWMPGPYETVVGAPPSGGIEPGSGRSSPKPAWQNPNPRRSQTSSGRSSPLPMWQNSNQSPGMSMPTLPMRPGGRVEDSGVRVMDTTRGTLQPGFSQTERASPRSSSTDVKAKARVLRPIGLGGPQSTDTYSERSGHPPGPPPYPREQNVEPQRPQRPYAPPSAFSAAHESNPGHKNFKSGAGQRNFPDPLAPSSSSGFGSKTTSAGGFPGFKADRPAPAGSSQIISEEKLIASFINPKEQKSLESGRSKSRTPRRKAEGEELLRAIEAFDALLFSDTTVGTTKARHK